MNIHISTAEYPYLIPVNIPMTRIGNPVTDGGYVIPQKIVNSVNGVLSLGIGDDWSFDDHFHSLRPDCIIHSYDSTLEFEQFSEQLLQQYKKTFHNNVVHFQENIGRKDIREEFTELDTAINRLNKDNIFIKMDIEGGEYTLTKDICKNKSIIAGLVIEYHGAASTSKHCFLEELPVLCEHFQVVHIHANNSGPVINGFPDYLELTFIRKDIIDNAPFKLDTYIEGVDKPCSLFLDDYKIVFQHD